MKKLNLTENERANVVVTFSVNKFHAYLPSGALVVDPALYRGEYCNDSETKQCHCPKCGNEFDGELPHWLAGQEECPECDNLFYVDRIPHTY